MAGPRGFTLIELVMTLLIVAILAVFVVSRLDFTAFKERGYHDKLKAALQFARKAAVAQRRHVCVSIAGGVVTFMLDPNVPESVATPNCTVSLALPSPDSACAGTANEVCPPAGVAVSGANFRFSPAGASSAAVTFTSTGQPDIRVENETGYVH